MACSLNFRLLAQSTTPLGSPEHTCETQTQPIEHCHLPDSLQTPLLARYFKVKVFWETTRCTVGSWIITTAVDPGSYQIAEVSRT